MVQWVSAVLICYTGVAHANTWGTKPFENKLAVEWLADLKSRGADSIADALKRVNDRQSGSVPSDVCATAIAAASVVAAARDGSTELLDPLAATWLQSSDFTPDSKLSKRAKDAVQTCRGARRSQLYMDWLAIPAAPQWLELTKALLRRLES